MWLKNAWQVAAFAEEVEHHILARRFLNEPVILWRTQAGRAIAMEDRCPHRYAPLSIASLQGDEVRCGYHGMQFDQEGRCTHVPGQDDVPAKARVKVYPVVERYNLIWIWLGKPELSDPSQVPDVHWMDDEKWVPSRGYHHIRADYRLITDNLLDLSHETYVHKETIGNDAVADSPVEVKLDRNRIIRAHREMPNIDPPPLFAQMLNHRGKINRWQIAIYMPPGMHMTEAGVHPVETSRDKAFMFRALHLLTPETDSSTHYFWGVCRNGRLDDQAVTEAVRSDQAHLRRGQVRARVASRASARERPSAYSLGCHQGRCRARAGPAAAGIIGGKGAARPDIHFAACADGRRQEDRPSASRRLMPQRSPPLLLTTAACGGLRSAPDCRPRRAFPHLSYSYAAPFGPTRDTRPISDQRLCFLLRCATDARNLLCLVGDHWPWG